MAILQKSKSGDLLSAQKWNQLIDKVNTLEKKLVQQQQTATAKITALEKKIANQKPAQNLIIRSGVIKLNGTGHDLSSPLLKAKNHLTPMIKLQGFTRKPAIFYSLTDLNTAGGKDTKLWIRFDTIDKTKFRLKFGAFGNAQIYEVGLKWVAIGY